MAKMAKRLTGYRSFWPIWLGCAGKQDGRTLFDIQRDWGITTNYLYHKEPGLKMPMYKAMAGEGFTEKGKRKINAKFDWIPEYVIGMHKPPHPEKWSINLLMLENWPLMQEFIKKHSAALFSPENMKILYGNVDTLSRMAPYIFDDIFTLAIVSNILPFCAKYGANMVSRILYTMIALSPGRNLLDYCQAISKQIGDGFPRLISDENVLMNILSPSE